MRSTGPRTTSKSASTSPFGRRDLACQAIVLMLAGSVLVGCGEQAPTVEPRRADVHFLIRKEMETLPAALVDGRLDVVNRCLVVIAPGIKHVVMWPPGTVALTVDGSSVGIVETATGRTVATVGTRVRLGGGEIKSDEHALELMQSVVPEECQTGLYWLTSEVNPPAGP